MATVGSAERRTRARLRLSRATGQKRSTFPVLTAHKVLPLRGGAANKFGIRYERQWTILAQLEKRVLDRLATLADGDAPTVALQLAKIVDDSTHRRLTAEEVRRRLAKLGHARSRSETGRDDERTRRAHSRQFTISAASTST